MRAFFVFHCCFALVLFLLGFSPIHGLLRDSQQLISFKNSLPYSHFLNWDSSIPPCSFSGISCKDSKVSSIDLSNYNLGTDFSKVATFLLPLQNLESLVLKRTNISGAISSVPRFSCSSFLTLLDLSENAISGPVSDVSFLKVCSGLVSLNLSENSMGPFAKGVDYKLTGLLGLNFLDVSYNKISGENVVSWLLSSEFPQLQYLSLKGNRLGGNLPEMDLKNLVHLDLSLNNFSTKFPPLGDCSSVQHLDLSSNKFIGDIGDSLSTCVNLTFLNLTNSFLTGTIPNLPSGRMRYVYLQENAFSGVFPPHLLDLCTTLVELDLSFNNITGAVPETLAECSSLELLDISHNNFTGELPVDTLIKLSSLKTLMMSFNNFVGGLPDSFSEMVNLEVLDVSSNNIAGLIPPGLCQGSRNSLRVLYLQNNMFTGPIPDGLSNCSHLESLDLSFNYLDGTIPPSLGSLSNLRDVIMWLNQLHGEIPQEFMHLQSLEKLILDFNYLTGSIPAGLSNCTNLNWISLSSNGLSGEIPTSLGHLANLAILKLGNNSLSGNIPGALGDCLSLVWLDLNTNLLHGSIPPALFKQSGNIAVPLVPAKRYVEIKNDGTKQCHGAGNLLEFEGIRGKQLDRISARYPCKLGTVYNGNIQATFDHNGSMLFLDLSYNKLDGVMPKELGSMFYLFVLNLGHNDLSGPIPEELGSLRSLAILDLSYNRLNGIIPPSMTSLSFGDIDLSNNNLTGVIPESAPFDTIPEYRFMNNSGLCGYPLPRCVTGPGPQPDPQRKPNRSRAYLAGSIAVGLLFSLFCVFGLIIFAVDTKKRRRKREAALEAYMENHSNSATANSVWKLGAREALSVNLATFDKPLRKLTFADLLEATNGFHNDCLVGSGGFGNVYKAQLKDGNVVAIKKLIRISGQGEREFTAEMETIGRIKHRNLVPMLGYCKVGEERLLVYEYMKYGSLEDVLHDKKKIGIKLNWPARRRIAVGAARGLAYLHHNCTPHIIHRDMKSSNVLLDDNLEARVSDFGMARMMNTMDTHLSVSTLAGTPGYVPPEYYQSCRCSTKGDVYSYGVVLLELLTGRQPTDSFDFGDNNLVDWVKQHAKMRKSDVFDPALMKEDPSMKNELVEHLNIACACLDDRPGRRPTMIQVMAKLKQIQTGLGMDSSSSVAIDDGGLSAAEGVEMSIKEGNEVTATEHSTRTE